MYPVLFHVFGFPVYTYGVFMALALLASVQWAVYYGQKKGFSEDNVLNLSICAVVSAMVSARLFHVYVYWDELYARDWWQILKVYEGGLVFYGGLIGGTIGGITYWYMRKLDVLKMWDVASTAISLGQSIGRIGCFFYGCCFGVCIAPTSSLATLGVHFPGHNCLRHPTQIYASVANFLIFLTLIYIGKKVKTKGLVVVSYCYIYGVFRFCLELIRGDERGHVLGIAALSTSQVISLATIVFGLLLHIYILKYVRNKEHSGSGNSEN